MKRPYLTGTLCGLFCVAALAVAGDFFLSRQEEDSKPRPKIKREQIDNLLHKLFVQDIDKMAARSDSVNALYAQDPRWPVWISQFGGLQGEKDLHVTAAAVDRAVNAAIKYEYDSLLYKEREYFAAPLTCLLNGQGDCEDQAALKAATLIALGIDPARLSLVGVNEDRASISSNHIILKIDCGTTGKPDDWYLDILPYQDGKAKLTFVPAAWVEMRYRIYMVENLASYAHIAPKGGAFGPVPPRPIP